MPVTEDEMYRQLCEDYRHHLRWRERLFAGFLAVIGALAIAFYHTHKRDNSDELLFALSSVVLLVGALLSGVFYCLDRRCHEVLLDRREAGQALEQGVIRIGLFGSAARVSRKEKLLTHSRILKWLYLFSAVALSVFVLWWLGGLHDLLQWLHRLICNSINDDRLLI
jgi:hypothetical protein